MPERPAAELELALPPDQVARVLRHRALTGGRWRGGIAQLVWHDSANGDQAGSTLAGRGLALQRIGAIWQLIRLTPDGEIWPPGGPPPVLAEGDDPAAFAVPAGLPPIARFEGRVRTRQLADLAGTAGGIRVTLLEGMLRSINQEAPCCRMTLAGPPELVAELAATLGRSLDVAVPPASLAAMAVALARGERPAPRHVGAIALPADLTVGQAFPLVAGHLTGVILHWAPLVAGADHEATEAVHQMRVALRRLRAALSVFAAAIACPAVEGIRTELRTLAARLGPARDWDVFVTETGAALTAALPRDELLARLLEAADSRRRLHHADLRRHLASPSFRRLGIALAGLAIAHPWQASADPEQQAALARPLVEHAAAVLRQRSRKIMKRDADLSRLPAEHLHAIRLQAKKLRYTTEFFRPLFPSRATRPFLSRLARLQERLGHLNDAAVAGGLMAELGSAAPDEARGLVRGFLAAGGRDTRPRAAKSWKKFRKHQPFLKSVNL